MGGGAGMKAWLRSVDNYWFGKGSPTALGVIRILVGFFALLDLLMLSVSFNDWFGEKSYVPLSLAEKYIDPLDRHFSIFGVEKLFNAHPTLPFTIPRVNLLTGITSTPLLAIAFGVVCLSAFFTMIGLWTKLSSIVLALGIVSIHHRNGLILNGGDTVLRIAVLYLALSPCGLACSVDRLRALWKGRVGPEAPQVSLWTQKLLQYNLALCYFTTFWLKFGQGSHWRDLTATYYAAHINEFQRFPVPEFMNRPPVVYLTSILTLVIELALGTLVFYKPARRWVLLGGLGLHGFIEYSMNIPLFAFIICSLYVCFYSGEEIADFFKRVGRAMNKWATVVSLPRGTRLRTSAANGLAAVDALGLVLYKPGLSEELPAQEVKKSWTRSLATWPVGWIPGLWKGVLTRSLEVNDEPANKARPEGAAPTVSAQIG